MASKKSPNVTTVTGRVNNIKRGFTTEFKNANTAATKMAMR